ncbi:MAG: hypothetical protein ACYC3I_21085 [Gemmataceae bacterium]
MRKLIWCCSAAAVLTAGGFLSLAYYAYRCPETLVGRSMRVIADASIAMQPLSGLTNLVVRTSQSNAPGSQTPGAVEECVPADPHPVAAEHKEEVVLIPAEVEQDAAPIVIGEDDPMPHEVMPPDVAAMPLEQVQEMPANGCTIVMPYCCQDDDEPRVMRNAEGKADGSNEEAEQSVFKEWMAIFTSKEGKAPAVEELPPPTEEEPRAEPKCQEDPHRHEQLSGCPRVTCPYTGKSYPASAPAMKKGREEISEEPPQPSKKPNSHKGCKGKDQCPRTEGVDTMEYRKSDAGLNEYGPGPNQ